MGPVVGLDVSKGTSMLQAFTDRNKPYGKIVSITHTEEGFECLSDLLEELKRITGLEPAVVLEATGHYHRGLVAYLERGEYRHYIVNPLQSKRAKGTQLRKVKTDAVDAWHLAEMFYRGDIQPHRTWAEEIAELQHLTRQHEFMTSLLVQAKQNARALMDQVCPSYEGVFHNLFSITSLQVLRYLLRGDTITAEMIRKTAGSSHGEAWIRGKVERIQALPSLSMTSKAQQTALLCMVEMVLAQQEQLRQLEIAIEETALTLPEVGLLKTIPGVGDKLAAALAAEIGDAAQFKDPKQLVAYAGLDPGVHSSGKFTASSNRISKRGSKRLRRALYVAVQCGLRNGVNERLKTYYEKKRKEGKPYKVVVIACANKLLHHVYAILSKSQPYKS
ncbi:IS110 family transposase [Paenibacillus elgii]|uniref:IS110 family transposase n=1 Tax=Paenibacillus elgii TaxID=189691 RepID=UPI00203C6B41|nr:IS110 family transposase [Paenibacillus elgii]MCM3273325.1 IS110 family transposase [Paenibacillus elgii]